MVATDIVPIDSSTPIAKVETKRKTEKVFSIFTKKQKTTLKAESSPQPPYEIEPSEYCDLIHKSLLYDPENKKEALIALRMTTLTSDENTAVDSILTNKSDEEAVVVKKFNIPVKFKDIRRLKDGRWLNDEVTYCNLLLTYNR